ncbi:hypothetical protein [Haloplanus salinarum]|uniref:hypothetical protein n=1 Tax=Haloplanus salinarum TaxID=1912324 RepID=UPI00214AE7AD|nr:hypothetical protein [Haloplanus salinarum]
MSLRSATPWFGDHPLATELAAVVLALLGVHLWRRIVTVLGPAVSNAVPVGGDGPLTGALLPAGLVAYAGAYAALRGVDVGLALPTGRDRRRLALALLLPPGLVACTKLVGDATGVPYNALTTSAWSAGTPATTFLALLGPGVVVGACSLTVVCQLLVQGTFERVVDGRRAAVLTTVLAAVVLTGAPAGLTAFPRPGKLALAVTFVGTLWLALHAAESVDSDALAFLAYLPLTAVLGLVVVSWVAATDSVAVLLYGTTQVAVLWTAADGYDRTDSLLLPAVAYGALLLSQEAVVFLLEAGMRSW